MLISTCLKTRVFCTYWKYINIFTSVHPLPSSSRKTNINIILRKRRAESNSQYLCAKLKWTRAGQQGASCLPTTTTYISSLRQVHSAESPRNRSVFLLLWTYKELVHFQRESTPAQIEHLNFLQWENRMLTGNVRHLQSLRFKTWFSFYQQWCNL